MLSLTSHASLGWSLVKESDRELRGLPLQTVQLERLQVVIDSVSAKYPVSAWIYARGRVSIGVGVGVVEVGPSNAGKASGTSQPFDIHARGC